jgi:hypothetical protein
MNWKWSVALLLLAMIAAAPLTAQVSPASPAATAPPAGDPPHDASGVDGVGLGSAIATPLPMQERRRLQRYEIPELSGARQAIGSQTIAGELPKPVADFIIHSGIVKQRLSLFEGGLVVVQMTGAGANLRKRLVLPADAATVYTRHLSPDRLATLPLEPQFKMHPNDDAMLRLYRFDGSVIERHFDPSEIMSKTLSDQVAPLQDLLRAISIDREVTNSIANYDPAPGDQLVADDSRIYKVIRVFGAPPVVELRCLNQPTSIYVAKKDLYNYFIGRRDTSE